MLGIDKLLPKKRVSDMLPWIAACGDNRTIYTKAGGFLQVAKIEARPLDAASWPAIDTYYDQLAALEGRADDGWTFFHDRWKWQKDANLPMCSFGGNRAAQLIDWSERRQFAEDKAFDRTLFVALHYEPEHARAGLAQWLVGRDTAFSETAELIRFREQIEKFWAELWHIVPQVTLLEASYDPRLKGDALGSYLSMVANYEATPATLPCWPNRPRPGHVPLGLRAPTRSLPASADLADAPQDRPPSHPDGRGLFHRCDHRRHPAGARPAGLREPGRRQGRRHRAAPPDEVAGPAAGGVRCRTARAPSAACWGGSRGRTRATAIPQRPIRRQRRNSSGQT